MTALVNTETGEISAPALTASEARALTDELRQTLRVGHDLLIRAFQGRAWAALGYESWDAYCVGEFAESRMVRLDREQRREIAVEMRAAGMSQRAIASGLGVNEATVNRDLRAGVADATPAREDRPLTQAECEEIERRRVTGSDGKSYPAARPTPSVPSSAPRRPSIVDEFSDAISALTRAVDRVSRLAADDRLPRNADQVAARYRSDLTRATDALHGVIARLP